MKLPPTKICLFALALAATGCASTTVTGQRQDVTEAVPRPNQIWVYDFVATASDIPADSSLRGQFSPSSAEPTAQQISAGRQLGTLIARDLVADIQSMGLPAALAGPGTSAVSVEGGSAAKRFVVGFGSGTSEMDSLVEGYVMTAQGLRRLGSGTLSSSGSRTPGMIVPAAVAIASGNPVG
jgi:hypothetical protein